jgi:hypothetical protein
MAAIGLGLFLSAMAALTIPANLPGTPLEGAQMIVSLQCVAFCAVAVLRGAWFLLVNRKTVAQMVRDLSNAQ